MTLVVAACLALATAQPALTPLEARTLERVRASLPQRTVPALSGPLVEAARALARAAARGDPRPLSEPALRSALGDAGVFDPAPAAVLLSASPSSLPDAMADAARFRGASHLGIGAGIEGDLAWAVLLASEQRAEIDPFPRRVVPGSRATLRGRLLRLEGPRVWVSEPSGAVVEVPVQTEGDRFSAPVSFPGPGTWRVEVGGTGPRGATMAALLVVESGANLVGQTARAARPSDEVEPPDDAAAALRIRGAIDELRARQGLPPLRGDARLDRLARRHAEAMLAAGTLAHRLDGTPDLSGRLAGEGVPFRAARENLARGDGALDSHRATVGSPAHLASLLDPEMQLLGLGIARGALPGGQPVVYLAEILLAPRAPLPAEDAPAGVR